MTIKRRETPLTRSQNDIVARLRAVLEASRIDDDEKRHNALVHGLDRAHAEQLMDRSVQGDNEVNTLLAGYPETAPTRETILANLTAPQPTQLIITVSRVLDRAWSLRQDLLLLSEYAWLLGRDGLDTHIANDATQAVHAAFRAVTRFHQAYGLELPGEADGQMHPALQAAVDDLNGDTPPAPTER